MISKTVLIGLLAGAFLLGLLAGIWLNWAEVDLILTHFAVLWAIPSNRPEILRLTGRILLLGLLCAAAATLWPLFFASLAVKAPSPAKRSLSHSRTTSSPSHDTSRSMTPPAVRPSSTLPPGAPRQVFPSPAGGTMPPPPISLELPKERTPRDVPLPADSPLPASVISVTPQTPQAPVKEAAMLDVTVSEERITLDVAVLKRLSVTMRIPERAEAYPVEVERLSLKAQLLIAYMASARSKVPLGILREAIFGTDATYPEQVQQAFSTAKRDVRRRLDEAADLARQELGAALVPEDLALDLFKLVKNKRYRLPEYCRVVDLDLLWQQYRIIEHARANRELVQSVPEHVQHAAAAILTVWQGDFIEDLLDQADHAALIEDWPNYWAREPFTRLRHIYLEAVLYAAEYERKRGDADTARRKAYYEAAASLFAKGALAACNPRVFDGRFDLKVSFNKDPIGPHGSHVSRSEQYLRRALALFGIIGDTTAAAQLFADYRDQMQVCSGGIWSPHPKTARIVESVGQRTGAYQFSELVEVPDDLLSS